jgi:uncharacterized protein (TIGR02246 family)
MIVNVPAPVAEYLAAERAKNAEELAQCFADDAVVHDEGQHHRGKEAIRQWKEVADAKYQYVSEPLIASTEGDIVKVRARLTGDFPGSPVELIHVFQLANNRIQSLEIHS